MARGKRGSGVGGRGRGRSTSTSSSIKDQDAPVTQQSAGVQNCISCSKDVGEAAIGCDKCECWVHNTEMCSGLPQHVIDAIVKYDGAGISFICLNCRLDRGKSPSGGLTASKDVIAQLSQQIKGICAIVRELVEQVKVLTSVAPAQKPIPTSSSQPDPQPTAVPRPQQPAVDYRSIVHEELKEMREREKRRQSVIIKGLRASSSGDLTSKFEQLTEQVMGSKVSLSDVSSISGHPNIYRAKIMSDDLRKTVLEKAKMLRDTDYSSVYISRDLTYAQRSELFARRKARQSEPVHTQNLSAGKSQTENTPRPDEAVSVTPPTHTIQGN